MGEPGCAPTPSIADRLPLKIPVAVGWTPGLAPVAGWPWYSVMYPCARVRLLASVDETVARSPLEAITTLPRAGSEASWFVVTFLPASTRNPEGRVTPGPTLASAETIEPGSMMAPSTTAPGPISVGLTAVPYVPMTLGPRILAP